MTETAGPLAPGEPYVLAAAASGVIDMIESEGGDVDRIFGRARIDTSRLDSPLSELGLKQYCRLFEEAARWRARAGSGTSRSSTSISTAKSPGRCST